MLVKTLERKIIHCDQITIINSIKGDKMLNEQGK